MANTNQMMNINGQMVPKVDVFKGVINGTSIRNQLKSCLGKHAGNFLTSMLDLYSSDGYLQNCDPYAVAMECVRAASLNLPINKGLGFAYVVPFKNRKTGTLTPQFILGWKGHVQLAQRTGQYVCINTDAIYEGEKVRTNRLTGQIEITGSPTSQKAIGYFAYFRLTNGFEKMLYKTRAEVEAYGRKYSPAYNSGPWQTEFDAMAKKTVLRQVLKYGPMSTEMQKAEEYEAMAAQRQAQENVLAKANQVPLDIPPRDAEIIESIEVDQSTGEVIGDAAASLQGAQGETEAPPEEPGF